VSVPALAFVLTGLVNAGAFFFWGGKITQMLRDHERRIARLEDAHDREKV